VDAADAVLVFFDDDDDACFNVLLGLTVDDDLGFEGGVGLGCGAGCSVEGDMRRHGEVCCGEEERAGDETRDVYCVGV